MTVIAFDGNMIAADKRTTYGDTISISTKLFRVPGGVLGIAGVANPSLEFVDWFRNGRNPDTFPPHLRGYDDPSFDILFITTSKQIYRYSAGPTPIMIEDKIAAIGSGADCALAAMMAGLPADKAVILTSKIIASCGNGVTKIKL